MGSSQSMYVVLIQGDIEVCPLGVFSTLEKAKAHVGEQGRRVWIEKFCVDQPHLYEDAEEYIVWKSW